MNRVICSGVFSFSSVSFTLIHWPCFGSSLDWKKALQWFVLKSSCSVWCNFKSHFRCSITMADSTRWTVAVWHGCSTCSYGSVPRMMQYTIQNHAETNNLFWLYLQNLFWCANCNNSLPCIYSLMNFCQSISNHSLMNACQSISNLICEWHLVHNLLDI